MRPSRNERGQVLVLTALSMVVLLGIAALSVDASFMYDKRNQLYAAADAAAKIGAAEVQRNPMVSVPELKAFADQQAVLTGLTPAPCLSPTPGTTSVCINHPPVNGMFAGNPDYVEAIVSQVTSTFFAPIIAFAHLTPGARAVAGVSTAPGCFIALGTGDPGITNTGGSISANACAIMDGGNLHGQNITGPSIGVVGGASASCGGCSPLTTNLPSPADPLSALPAPTPAECGSGGFPLSVTVSVGPPVTILPGTYANITFGGGTLIMQSGIYCITGAITVAGGPGVNVTWNDQPGGVLIYFAAPTASLNLDSDNVNITLEAQTVSLHHKGILFYQDSGNSTTAKLSNNGGTITVDGVLYFPAAPVQMNNVNFGSSNQCSIVVAKALDSVSPTIALDKTCASFGGSPIQTISVAE